LVFWRSFLLRCFFVRCFLVCCSFCALRHAFLYAASPLSKAFAFGELLSFALPKESNQRKRNPVPLESPLKKRRFEAKT
jgi:hypothetical protein